MCILLNGLIQSQLKSKQPVTHAQHAVTADLEGSEVHSHLYACKQSHLTIIHVVVSLCLLLACSETCLAVKVPTIIKFSIKWTETQGQPLASLQCMHTTVTD